MPETNRVSDYGKNISVRDCTVIQPDSNRLITALRQIGYSLEQALSDLIDNAINAGACNVLIRFLWAENRIVSVVIADDGAGIPAGKIDDAMRFGSPKERIISSLGKYGMGLKLASLSHAQVLTVVTRQNGKTAARRWTLSGLKNGWECDVLDKVDATQHIKAPWGPLDLTKSGTLVIWDDVDRLPTSAKGLKITLKTIQKRLEVHLGLHFHRFLERSNFRIFLDQQRVDYAEQDFAVQIEPLNPFGYSQSGHHEYPKQYVAEIKGVGSLALEAHIWPANSKMAGYKLGNRAAARQGFYFYRNDRLIQAGGWNGLVQSDSEPHSSLARIAIDLPVGLDSEFGLNVQKSAVLVPPDFERAIMDAKDNTGTGFEEYRAVAQNIYRNIDDKAIRRRPCVPTHGIPKKLSDEVRNWVGVEKVNEVTFHWRRLPEDKVFEIDIHGRDILLNSRFRKCLTREEKSSVNDLAIIKMLIYYLVEGDILSERISAKSRKKMAYINAILSSSINE